MSKKTDLHIFQPPMNILIIEDDKVTLKTLQHSIESLGNKVYIAENGEEAMHIIDSETIDLILSDIMMPGISGLSLINVLRSVNLCDIPIIIMSALNNKALLDAAFAAGANDFIAKPFNMDAISEKLQKYSKNIQAKI